MVSLSFQHAWTGRYIGVILKMVSVRAGGCTAGLMSAYRCTFLAPIGPIRVASAGLSFFRRAPVVCWIRKLGRYCGKAFSGGRA